VHKQYLPHFCIVSQGKSFAREAVKLLVNGGVKRMKKGLE